MSADPANEAVQRTGVFEGDGKVRTRQFEPMLTPRKTYSRTPSVTFFVPRKHAAEMKRHDWYTLLPDSCPTNYEEP